jgi:hypothetical protein
MFFLTTTSFIVAVYTQESPAAEESIVVGVLSLPYSSSD